MYTPRMVSMPHHCRKAASLGQLPGAGKVGGMHILKTGEDVKSLRLLGSNSWVYQ